MKFIPIYDKDNIKVEVDVDRAPIIFRFKIDNKLYKISYRDYSAKGKSFKDQKKLVDWLKHNDKEILNILANAPLHRVQLIKEDIKIK